MALSVRNPEAERLAREASRMTGQSMTEVIIDSLREKIARIHHDPVHEPLQKRILRIGSRCAALPTLDTRSEEEILGYSDAGLS